LRSPTTGSRGRRAEPTGNWFVRRVGYGRPATCTRWSQRDAIAQQGQREKRGWGAWQLSAAVGSRHGATAITTCTPSAIKERWPLDGGGDELDLSGWNGPQQLFKLLQQRDTTYARLRRILHLDDHGTTWTRTTRRTTRGRVCINGDGHTTIHPSEAPAASHVRLPRITAIVHAPQMLLRQPRLMTTVKAEPSYRRHHLEACRCGCSARPCCPPRCPWSTLCRGRSSEVSRRRRAVRRCRRCCRTLE